MIAKHDIEALKAMIARIARPLLMKYLTRGTLWVLTSVFGLAAASSETSAGEIGYGLATITLAVTNLLIDRWHHKTDLAEGQAVGEVAGESTDSPPVKPGA